MQYYIEYSAGLDVTRSKHSPHLVCSSCSHRVYFEAVQCSRFCCIRRIYTVERSPNRQLIEPWCIHANHGKHTLRLEWINSIGCLANSRFNLYNYSVDCNENETFLVNLKRIRRLWAIASANRFISKVTEKNNFLQRAKKKESDKIQKLTSIVMAHSNIMANHMSHGASE